MKLRGFITHKAAEYYSDCADYFRICPQTKRVAVSDGVGQSVMPAEWARLLVDSYVEGNWIPGEPTNPLMETWTQQAWDYVNEQKRQGKNPWLLENCLINKDGAAATFCGIQFQELNNWSAVILGDTSLVELDEENHIVQVCSSKDGTFDFRPDFYESFGKDKGVVKYVSGKLENDHKILLVSDPFSELFQNIKGTESETSIILSILDIKDTDGFNSLVDSLRTDCHMHNDDSTLVIIEPDGQEGFNVVYEKSLDSSLEDEAKRLEEERRIHEDEAAKDEGLWIEATEEDNETAYLRYLNESPIKSHELQAKKRIKELIDENAEIGLWETAVKENNVDGYNKYLEAYPNGRYVEAAKDGLSKLNAANIQNKKPDSEEESIEEKPSEDPVCQCEETEKQEKPAEKGAPSDSALTLPPVPKVRADTIAQTGENDNDIESFFDEHTKDNPGRNTKELRTTQSSDSEQESNRIHQEEVEIDQEAVQYSLPVGVDPSDGIDRKEFIKLQEIALSLFGKYHSRFEKLFSRPKWNQDRTKEINQCFKDFWGELEGIIYHKTEE